MLAWWPWEFPWYCIGAECIPRQNLPSFFVGILNVAVFALFRCISMYCITCFLAVGLSLQAFFFDLSYAFFISTSCRGLFSSVLSNPVIYTAFSLRCTVSGVSKRKMHDMNWAASLFGEMGGMSEYSLLWEMQAFFYIYIKCTFEWLKNWPQLWNSHGKVAWRFATPDN